MAFIDAPARAFFQQLHCMHWRLSMAGAEKHSMRPAGQHRWVQVLLLLAHCCGVLET